MAAGPADFDDFVFFPKLNKPICFGGSSVLVSIERSVVENKSKKVKKIEKAKKRVGGDERRFLTDRFF
jgi:hypothetical protein